MVDSEYEPIASRDGFRSKSPWQLKSARKNKHSREMGYQEKPREEAMVIFNRPEERKFREIETNGAYRRKNVQRSF